MSKNVVEFVAGAALVVVGLALPGSTILGSAALFNLAQAQLLLSGATLAADAVRMRDHVAQLRISNVSTTNSLPVIYGRPTIGGRIVP